MLAIAAALMLAQVQCPDGAEACSFRAIVQVKDGALTITPLKAAAMVESDDCVISDLQAALAESTTPAAPPSMPQIPRQGGYYCDPVFGRRITRISDDGESIAVVGGLGFAPGNGAIATVTAGGGVRVYRLRGAVVGAAENTPANWNAWWASDHEIAYTEQMKVLAFDIDTKRITTKADLSSLFPGGALQRCTAAADGLTFACSIMQPSDNYPRIGYVAAKLDGAILAKFVNGIDSADLKTSQSVAGIPIVSAYEPGPSDAGGYKLSIDDSGGYLLFNLSDKYNSMAALNIKSGRWGWMHGAGHGDAGAGDFLAMNTAYGTCPTSIKRWKLAELTADPHPDKNTGECLTEPVGWTFTRQYLSAAAGRIAVVLGCLALNCPGPFAGEVYEVGEHPRRLAKLLFRDGAGYQEVQPVLSRDGSLLAFTTNLGQSNFKAVFMLRMP